jgi:ABC-type Fe3+-hydroxamate transport system substrate-binding protein
MAFAKELAETKRAFLNQVSNRHVGLGEKALLLISNIESIKDNQKISSSQLFIGGQDGFYSDILEYLGASNALSQQTVSLDSIGMEGIIAMNPTVIFEIFEKPLSDLDRKKRLQSWKEWSMIKAVADSRVYLVDKDYAGIPGPRFDLLLSDFERVLGSVTDD